MSTAQGTSVGPTFEVGPNGLAQTPTQRPKELVGVALNSDWGSYEKPPAGTPVTEWGAPITQGQRRMEQLQEAIDKGIIPNRGGGKPVAWQPTVRMRASFDVCHVHCSHLQFPSVAQIPPEAPAGWGQGYQQGADWLKANPK